jgi:hypothetical protein
METHRCAGICLALLDRHSSIRGVFVGLAHLLKNTTINDQSFLITDLQPHVRIDDCEGSNVGWR